MTVKINDTVSVDSKHMIISGKIDFNNVMEIEQYALSLLDEQQQVCYISFAQLTAMNSAGLALIVSIFKYMQRCKRRVVFEQLPENAIKLSKISDLHTLLPLR